ncbi:DUF7693 family protein [Pseudomonas azerbaijanoccidentalis]
MRRACKQSWSEIYHGLISAEIDGWRLTLFNDCGTLGYCEECRSPDGRVESLETRQRCGTDPVEFLSGWNVSSLSVY